MSSRSHTFRQRQTIYLTDISEYGKRIRGIESVFVPRGNAAERVSRTVLTAIKTYLQKDHVKWDLYLPETEVSISNALH